MGKRVARVGVFAALAMIFSYVEVLIPFPIGIPGVKLGIANTVIVAGLYFLDIKEVWMISMIRIFLMGLLFGNGISFLYSLAGGILSLTVMMLLKKINQLSMTGVSVAGAVAHNIGQLLAATFVLGNIHIMYYLAVLLFAGILTGLLIGFLASKITGSLKLVLG